MIPNGISRRKEGRAAFLAVLVVLSVIALSAPLAGTAAAIDGPVSADRTVTDQELTPGESTQVTVEVNASGQSNFTVVEQFDPAFESVELVDDDGADFSGVTDANDELFATYGDREQVTLTYELTVGEDATASYAIDGFVDATGVQTNTTGDTTVETADLLDQITALKEEITALEEKNADLEENITALEEEIATLEEEIATLEEENADLEEENADLEEENTDLEEENADLTEEVAELEEQLEETNGTDDSTDGGDDGVPGFGIAIAITALIATALLAVRSQN